MIVRLALAAAVGLVGAGIVHIVSVLSVPALSDTGALATVADLGPEATFHTLDAADPFVRARVCLATLDEPYRVVAEGDVPFWSAAVFAGTGEAVYSVNDRAANDGVFDIIVATPANVIALREELSAEGPELVAVEGGVAIVTLRSFAPDATFDLRAERFLSGASCAPLEVN